MSFANFFSWLLGLLKKSQTSTETSQPNNTGNVGNNTGGNSSPEIGGSAGSTDSPSTGGGSGSTGSPNTDIGSGNTGSPNTNTGSGNTDSPNTSGGSGNTDSPNTGGDTSTTDTPDTGSNGNTGLTSPPEPPVPVKPKLVDLKTASDPLTLYADTEFYVETEPRGQYENIEIELDASNMKVIKPFDKTTGIIVLRFNKRSRTAEETHTITATDGDVRISKTVSVSLFKLLWQNHAGRQNICDATRFRNQCAIRMGAALEASSINLSTDRRVLRRCSTEFQIYDDHESGQIRGHVLAAQELANWVNTQTGIFGKRSLFYSKEELAGRQGLIFFRDGWDTTDHIDFWDGEHLVGGFDSYFESDFKDLWFWDVY